MRKVYSKTAYGLTGGKATESVFSKNHYASTVPYSPEIQQKIAEWGLTRVAGNVWACPAKSDFWAVKGGKIMKLVGSEVDEGDSIPAAPENRPAAFLAGILDDLELF